MKLKVKNLDIEVGGKPIVLLNKEDAAELGLHTADRLNIVSGKKEFFAIVDITQRVVNKGEIGLFSEIANEVGLPNGKDVEVHVTETPDSVGFVKHRLMGETLDNTQIEQIVGDIVKNRLTDVEAVFFMASSYVKDFSEEETVSLAKAMIASGKTLDFGRHPVVDKHSIGGICGNRVTMVLVPIIAAAGLTIPKTSARAISSPSGTADTMEVLAPVELEMQELHRIVDKTNACIVWGGSINLVPADDKLAQIRYPLRLDPKPFMLASILAKKKAVGAEKVVVDIPVGKGAKIESADLAKELAYNFITIGNRLGIDVDCVITPGDKPVGRGIGPVLEARDVLGILMNKPDVADDLREKSLSLSGLVLEMGGKAQRGEGYAVAEKILTSGKALKKMREIIREQGGRADVRPEDLAVGKHKYTVVAPGDGTVYSLGNNAIIKIARAAGAPKDKGAGVYLLVKRGRSVRKGDGLYEIYAEQARKLEIAVSVANTADAVIMEKPILTVIENVPDAPGPSSSSSSVKQRQQQRAAGKKKGR